MESKQLEQYSHKIKNTRVELAMCQVCSSMTPFVQINGNIYQCSKCERNSFITEEPLKKENKHLTPEEFEDALFGKGHYSKNTPKCSFPRSTMPYLIFIVVMLMGVLAMANHVPAIKAICGC